MHQQRTLKNIFYSGHMYCNLCMYNMYVTLWRQECYFLFHFVMSWYTGMILNENVKIYMYTCTCINHILCLTCTNYFLVSSIYFSCFTSFSSNAKEEFTVLWFMNKRLCKKLMQRWVGMELASKFCSVYTMYLLIVIIYM